MMARFSALALAFALLALGATAVPAQARSASGDFATLGVGSQSCAAYLTARHKGGIAEERFVTWTEGYLSAFNLIVSNTYSILGQREPGDALVWLDTYCNQSPDARYVNAVAAMTVAFHSTRLNLKPGYEERVWPGREGIPPR
jgi:hypothetical protein